MIVEISNNDPIKKTITFPSIFESVQKEGCYILASKLKDGFLHGTVLSWRGNSSNFKPGEYSEAWCFDAFRLLPSHIKITIGND